MESTSTVYLIPSFLDASALQTIPAYVTDAIKSCEVFFVENERSARRFIKQLSKDFIIDDHEWVTIHKTEAEMRPVLKEKIKAGKTIGVISEAGCPGIADPGQLLVQLAQEMKAVVRPLVGPSSILLALMASGMNGQRFQFVGYLPIDNHERNKAIKELESESAKKDCTQIFIETPYRNNQLLEAIVKNCTASTRICVAADITGPEEWIRTKTIAEWSKQKPELHKRQVIFCLHAGRQ
jgi:16S rRNA (cytidine1402-2'-O)-methyltransferase